MVSHMDATCPRVVLLSLMRIRNNFILAIKIEDHMHCKPGSQADFPTPIPDKKNIGPPPSPTKQESK